ncbi:polymorphic toxin-type HINT domain-containing protein [Micromonospora sp. NPDC049366]|uniref:polymorphic toxin-type HINT domain-containing protein n=1 Tax=Micromonospora sp. NPDC049366 TaxID=3364271 RepID=UPI0037987F28
MAEAELDLAMQVCDKIGRDACGDWYEELFEARTILVCADYCDISADSIGYAAAMARQAIKAGRAGKASTASTSCGAMSFSGDTHVLMADGTTKPIADIRTGDQVLATDPETGEQGRRVVTRVWVHEDQLVDLKLDDNSSLTTTEDHPFWNQTKHRWQEAQDVTLGDRLLTPEGDGPAVNGIDWTTAHRAGAYNLTVDDIHTYYVLAGSSPVLVHNCPPGGGSVPSGQQGRGLQIPDGASKGQWLKERAGSLGFSQRVPAQKVPFDSKGQAAFFDGKRYITPDVTGHNTLNGWKMFDRKGNRLGTYDSDLNYLKP